MDPYQPQPPLAANPNPGLVPPAPTEPPMVDPQSGSEPGAGASNVKQQIVQRLNSAKNVLITVSVNPSVDELSATIGLTFLLDKLDKHVTAVFSGDVPAAIEFLDPAATFENNVDSLRDFIIALDKEKADKLRYKIEDDVVKIFITPYRTVINEEDLNFSQGDFNVDVIVALGVTARDDLDKAITAHGRILHDATVITVNAGPQTSNLGAIDWNDANASSVSEMLVSLSESFGNNLLDNQMSTAFLTGIVASTNRFSNEKTTPKVMTMAAQLMASGANQQLIASNLRQEGLLSEEVHTTNQGDDSAPKDNGEMVVEHADNKKRSKSGKSSGKTETKQSKPPKQAEDKKPETVPAESDDKVEAILSAKPQDIATEDKHKIETPPPVVQTPEESPVAAPEGPKISSVKSEKPRKTLEPIDNKQKSDEPASPKVAQKPTFGGTLNATTAESEEDKAKQEERETEKNHIALSHEEDDISSQSNEADLEAARRAVEEAAESAPFDPAGHPLASINATPITNEDAPELTNDSSADIPHGDEPVLAPSPMPTPEAAQPPIMPPAPTPVAPVTPPTPAMPAVMQPTSGMETPNVPTLPGQPPVLTPPSADMASPTGQPSTEPMDAFMQPHTLLPTTPQPVFGGPTEVSNQTDPNLSVPGVPPMPPMPGLPPMPPMPGQPMDQNQLTQPDIQPSFMQGVNQSQNPWTEAGQDLAAEQAQKDANRQARIDSRLADYDSAVAQNQQLQQQAQMQQSQPQPADHATFPLPPQA